MGGGLNESLHPEQKMHGRGSASGQEARRGEHVLGCRALAWHVGARGEMAHSVATTCCMLGSPGRCTVACSGCLQAAPRA